jgi:hypothetical protein
MFLNGKRGNVDNDFWCSVIMVSGDYVCEKFAEDVRFLVLSSLKIMSVGGGEDRWIKEKGSANRSRSIEFFVLSD